MKAWMRAAWAGVSALIAVSGVFHANARDGVVRAMDGTRFEGRIALRDGAFVVTLPSGEEASVPLERFKDLQFTTTAAAPATPTEGGGQPESPEGETDAAGAPAHDARADEAPADGKPPAAETPAADEKPPADGQWNQDSIGPTAQGELEEAVGSWTVKGSGLGLRGNADSVFLVHRPLEEAGQALAQLAAFDGPVDEAVAGVTLRDNLGEAAAYAFLGQRVGSGLCFQYRQIAGGMTMRVTNITQALPAWLRLSRSGGAVVAELSEDGRDWRVVGRANVNLGRKVSAGIVVASGVDGQMAIAQFRNPTVGARGLGYVPTTGYPRIVMRGGSVVQAPIVSADESVLRLGGDLGGSLVSSLNVARIEFLPLTPEIENRLETGRVGVALVDGDFVDGRLRGIRTNQVIVNSLLLGFRRFSAGTEAAAVQMGAVEPDEAQFRVELENGSMLRARRLELLEDAVRAESPLLGSIQAPVSVIRSVARVE